MKKTMKMTVLALALCCAAGAQARDTKLMFSVQEAMNANDAQSRLGNDIKISFGKGSGPKGDVVGSDKTSQKTNAFGKSAQTACNWAFLSGMLALKKRAVEAGADAMVVVSNYKNEELASSTEFECHEGAIMAGVALKAEFIRTGKK
jgi:hypothetical protein